ncbi:MAG: hypothetical protein M1133_07115 [Armatimonadetes bacterium]|nr:hypothetical protein [Armatimonadota bacterium]
MNTTVTPTQTGVRVSIPMKVRKPRGKTVILLPDMPRYIQREPRRDYQEAVAVAVARGHLWCEMLQSGKFSSLREMAAKFGLCESYMARLVRTASLAPDIVAAILDGNEPAGFSLNALIGAVPELWQEQRDEYGFANTLCDH